MNRNLKLNLISTLEGSLLTLTCENEMSLNSTGAVYHINVSPEILHIQLTNAMIIMINLTVSYNIQYNVSIVSSLCGVTTTRVLNYSKYLQAKELKDKSCYL